MIETIFKIFFGFVVACIGGLLQLLSIFRLSISLNIAEKKSIPFHEHITCFLNVNKTELSVEGPLASTILLIMLIVGLFYFAFTLSNAGLMIISIISGICGIFYMIFTVYGIFQQINDKLISFDMININWHGILDLGIGIIGPLIIYLGILIITNSIPL